MTLENATISIGIYDIKFVNNNGDIEIQVYKGDIFYKKSLNKQESLYIINIIEKTT